MVSSLALPAIWQISGTGQTLEQAQCDAVLHNDAGALCNPAFQARGV